MSFYNQDKKVNLLNFNRKQMRILFQDIGEKSFRADQVMKWIYHHHCNNFDLMTDINKSLRDVLKNVSEIRAPKIIKEYHSNDGVIKWIIDVNGQYIETVCIINSNRTTLCISSQAGCALSCTFCSTGQQGFNRNLKVYEIIGQVWLATKILKESQLSNNHPITNIVIMGMGEPLLNLNNVVSSVDIILDDFGFGISKKRVILSTAGIVPALNKLGDMTDIMLAISLHAPNDEIRDSIMPINKMYNIKSILNAAFNYLEKSNISDKYITIEYIMLNGINDNIEHAYQLIELLKGKQCKINLILWNKIPMSSYSCSYTIRIENFAKILTKHGGLIATVRKPRGRDINAACGQLTGNILNCCTKNKMLVL